MWKYLAFNLFLINILKIHGGLPKSNIFWAPLCTPLSDTFFSSFNTIFSFFLSIRYNIDTILQCCPPAPWSVLLLGTCPPARARGEKRLARLLPGQREHERKAKKEKKNTILYIGGSILDTLWYSEKFRDLRFDGYSIRYSQVCLCSHNLVVFGHVKFGKSWISTVSLFQPTNLDVFWFCSIGWADAVRLLLDYPWNPAGNSQFVDLMSTISKIAFHGP